MKITAAVLREPTGRFEIEELDLADPRDDEVLVKMVGAGLCHTDLLSREWPPEMFPGPIVYGHEGSGIVERWAPTSPGSRWATTSYSVSTAVAVVRVVATSARTPVTTSSRATSHRTVRMARRR